MIRLIIALMTIALPLTGCTKKLESSPLAETFSVPTTKGVFKTEEHRGKRVFLFFGFTRCPHICPTSLENLRRMNFMLTENERTNLEVLFISVDTLRDTMDVLGKRLNGFPANFHAGTDTEENLRTLISKFGGNFKVTPATDPNNITVDHTSLIYMLNPKGEWVASLDYDTSPEEMKKAFEGAERMSPMSSPHRKPRDIPVLAESKDCELSKTECDLEGYRVSIGPFPIQGNKEYKIQVKTASPQGTPVEVDFEGVENNMGYIRPKLEKTGPDLYSAAFRIPVCELPTMDWRAKLTVTGSQGSKQLVFKFKTTEPTR